MIKDNKFIKAFPGLAVGCVLCAVSFILYFASMANYAFPGESARLIALWRGLDVSAVTHYPLMARFAKAFGVGNAMAPVLGAVAVALFYLLSLKFFTGRAGDDQKGGKLAVRLGAAVGAVVFMLTPAVREAATHLEPRLFDFVWALLGVFVVWHAGVSRKLAWLFAIVAGTMSGWGLCDSPLALMLVPLYLVAMWSALGSRKISPWFPIVLFVLSMLTAFFWFAASSSDDFGVFARALKEDFNLYFIDGWLFVAVFATLPFAVSIFSSIRSLKENAGLTQLLFHTALTVVTILAVATPLSPSSQMAPYAILPVATSAFAAFTAAYLIAYWHLKIFTGLASQQRDVLRYIGYGVGGIFSVVVLFTLILNFFNFDSKRGDFADKVADKVLLDLDGRTWLVSDGSLDDNLLLAADRAGKELHIVSLSRDDDAKYMAKLTEEVKEARLGGDRNPELLLSLSLGVLPFVQDWFAADRSAKDIAAVWGAPDLWLRAGSQAIPEFFFFGANPAKAADWQADWEVFDKILHAPANWGSYLLYKNKNPIDRIRLNLRRHLGLVANNRGVWFEDQGNQDEAFKMFELVLQSIDSDNICSLLNEYELANLGHKSAQAKRLALEKKLKAIIDDSSRRYKDIPLSLHYGYIRSPEMYARHGMSWARSGRSGEALLNFGRAIDLVPTDRRTSLLNMMASLYAADNDQAKSRAIYEDILAKDAENHDALIGLMRLEMMNGNTDAAIAYLEKANAASGDDPRAEVEKAMLLTMKGDLAAAKQLLRKVTDANLANLQAWSFLAAVTIQQIDAAKDAAARASFMKELEDDILRTMEKQARDPSDYYVQTTRAFLLLRKDSDNRREARDALIAASRDRPDVASTGDMILGLDISLNDTVDAERHAREVLRRNRKAPLANYVMGSLALQRGEYAEAEAFLRRASDVDKPVVLALNDLAEVLRRSGKFDEAEIYARRAVDADPRLYVAWDTLATIILERNGDLAEAESCVNKAIELSRDADGHEPDVRMYISLARVQFAKGENSKAKLTLRKVQKRVDELSDFEKAEFEELRKRGK